MPALDQLLMHDRNLAGRAAETDETQFQPEFAGFGQAGARRSLLRIFVHGGGVRIGRSTGRAPVDSFAAVIAVSAAIF
ncbi:hypothetical protein A1356_15765 [Methylomonas koyamae]|uniref:Uncharacterized protein n=1 Tax=Methylomonas koyamae TaxID=702114 RepID=A0AA91DC37_9GAMM|nr:hypothetical protein A1356_15765 [Methylomonas koyamae]